MTLKEMRRGEVVRGIFTFYMIAKTQYIHIINTGHTSFCELIVLEL